MVQPYPNAPQVPETTATQRPPVPAPVIHAVTLMYVGIAVGVFHALSYILTAASTKAAYGRAHPLLSAHKVTTGAHVLVIGGVVSALVGSALFAWMALECRRGKNWARITGTVFFAIGVLGALAGLRMAEAPLVKVWPFVTVLVGLAAVMLLWRRSSTNYFNAGQRPPA
jgi:hypothetical protein